MPIGDPGADRDQRDRVPRRDRGGRAARRRRRRARSTTTARCSARSIAPERTSTGGCVTVGFLHDGLLHIAFNMLSLYFIGTALEPAIGSVNFAAVYFASLLAGSFGALLFQPGSRTVGASGAIFGIFGALIVVAHYRGIPIWQSGLGFDAAAQHRVLAQRPRDLDRRPPRRPRRRADHGLAGRRAGRAPADAGAGARPAAWCSRRPAWSARSRSPASTGLTPQRHRLRRS